MRAEVESVRAGPGRKNLAAAMAITAAVFLCTTLTGAAPLGPGASAPELRGAEWINTAPLDADSLRGKVRIVDFWTFG